MKHQDIQCGFKGRSIGKSCSFFSVENGYTNNPKLKCLQGCKFNVPFIMNDMDTITPVEVLPCCIEGNKKNKGEEMNYDKERADIIRHAAYDIAYYLKMDYRSKNRGGYDLYVDDRVAINLDTYYPNLSITIPQKDDEGKETYNGKRLFGSSDDRIHNFHDGPWVDHVLELGEKAAEVKKARQEKARAEQQRKKEAAYSPIEY